jgi:hypothetical protein
MADWPEAFAIANCIDWNQTELRRARRDVRDPELKVPPHLNKTVDGKRMPVTADEYRDMRSKDVDRYTANIQSLEDRT